MWFSHAKRGWDLGLGLSEEIVLEIGWEGAGWEWIGIVFL